MAEQEKEVFEGEGWLQKKEEALTKSGAKFWRFNVDGDTYGMFEYEAGKGVSVGEYVGFFYTQTSSLYMGKPIKYKNLNSIFQKEAPKGKKMEQPKADATPAAPELTMQERISLGQAMNQATMFICAQMENANDFNQAKKIMEAYLREGDYEKLVIAINALNTLIRDKVQAG